MLKKGFTLIEILLVLGIFIFVLLITPLFDLNFLKKESNWSEALIFIQTLQKSRNKAINNIDGKDQVVVFGEQEIVFSKLTGNVLKEQEIIFGNAQEEIKIKINYEGGIDW
jgi:prepilin-type N-terminal cleavage/methylation domain-containing protein